MRNLIDLKIFLTTYNYKAIDNVFTLILDNIINVMCVPITTYTLILSLGILIMFTVYALVTDGLKNTVLSLYTGAYYIGTIT